jgi:hypothetical protein
VLLNKESGTGAATLELDVLVTPACNDGVDSDGDGLVDYPNDPGCFAGGDDSEVEDCQDGRDNDNDGFIDFPADPQCTTADKGRERNPTCGVGGLELAGIGLLGLVRRKLRRRS